MKYLKGINESFMDYFRKDTPDDNIALDFVKRLEKITGECPYKIELNKDLPIWMNQFIGEPTTDNRNTQKTEHFSKIYLVRFDDVDLVISNDRHELVYQDGRSAGYERCENPWKLFVGSSVNDLSERIKAKDVYRKTIYTLVDKIYNSDIELKRIKKIKSNINTAADDFE